MRLRIHRCNSRQKYRTQLSMWFMTFSKDMCLNSHASELTDEHLKFIKSSYLQTNNNKTKTIGCINSWEQWTYFAFHHQRLLVEAWNFQVISTNQRCIFGESMRSVDWERERLPDKQDVPFILTKGIYCSLMKLYQSIKMFVSLSFNER